MLLLKKMWRYSIWCLLVLAGCGSAWAQDVVFTTNAGADKMGVEDRIQVTYTIENANNLQSMGPTRESLKDFDVVGGPYQSQSTQISYAGNRMVQSQSISMTLVLKPKRTGKLTIPPAYAKDAEGNTYESNALPLEVVKGSVAQRAIRQQPQHHDQWDDDTWSDDAFAAMQRLQQRRMQMLQQQQQQMQQMQRQRMQANNNQATDNIDDNIFIKVSVDKQSAHVGEQITASYKLYARVPMNVNISKLPSLNGFWTQDFDIPRTNVKPTEEIIDGKRYQVFLLKKSALFPQQEGTLVLDPAEAEGMARIMVKTRSPFADMFENDPYFRNAFGSLMMSDPYFNDDFFSAVEYRDVPVHLKSAPVNINVQPLPAEGKPENFSGAVGNFTVHANVDKSNFSTDDVATLTLTIKGSGNLKLIEAPQLNLPNGLSALDPQITDTVTGRSTTISGAKIITYTITPSIAGNYQIPAIPFTYFDPKAEKYVTLETKPVMLNVSQGNSGGNGNAIALTDIHGIETAPLKALVLGSVPVLNSPLYWAVYGIVLAAFIAMLFWKKREEKLSQNTVLLKSRRANKVALKRLVLAKQYLNQNKKESFYDEVSKALWLYLSDKLNIPLSELSRERAQIAMAESGISGILELETEKLLDECEAALYSPSGGTQRMKQTYEQAIEVISKLEDSFNTRKKTATVTA